MTAIGLGLFSVATAMILRFVPGPGLSALCWGGCAVAAVWSFVAEPKGYLDVLVWSTITLAVWILHKDGEEGDVARRAERHEGAQGGSQDRAMLIAASLAGFLIGAAQEHLAYAMTQVAGFAVLALDLNLPDALSNASALSHGLVMCVALLTGLTLASVAGGATAAVSAALGQGLFSQPPVLAVCAFIAVLAVLLRRHSPRGSLPVLAFFPVLAVLGGTI